MEWYYRQKHPDYPYDNHDDGAYSTDNEEVLALMEFIYPENGSVISLPRQIDGSPGEMVFNLAHHDRGATVFWHLDNEYLGETRFMHQYRMRPTPGPHTVTVVDGSGNTISVTFTILPADKQQ